MMLPLCYYLPLLFLSFSTAYSSLVGESLLILVLLELKPLLESSWSQFEELVKVVLGFSPFLDELLDDENEEELVELKN